MKNIINVLVCVLFCAVMWNGMVQKNKQDEKSCYRMIGLIPITVIKDNNKVYQIIKKEDTQVG